MIGVAFTYVSKIDNERMSFSDDPNEDISCKISQALEADEDETLILAQKILNESSERCIERSGVFGALARCNDNALDRLIAAPHQTPIDGKTAGLNDDDPFYS
jgi:hypothetical protein